MRIIREIDSLKNKISNLRDKEYSLWSKIRSFPSNNELRKESKGDIEFFEKLKRERDIIKEPIEKERSIIEKEISNISLKLKNLMSSREYLDWLWEKEGKASFLKSLDKSVLDEIESNGFSTEYLIQRAGHSKLARDILLGYVSPNYGRGYSGYSMSTNAESAYANGQKPLSKWNKEDLLEFNSLFNTKSSLKSMKSFLSRFGYSGYHHTSKFYNETSFYSMSDALQNCNAYDFVEFFGDVKGFIKRSRVRGLYSFAN